MKRFPIPLALALVACVALCAASAPRAWAFDWKDVAEMSQDGVSDDLILEKINHSGTSFSLDASDLRHLKQAGVSDRVITAMLRTEDQDGGDGGGYSGHPYVAPYGYYDPYWYTPGSRVYLDFGFGGWYGGRHYGYVGRGGRGYGGRGGFGGPPGGRHGYGAPPGGGHGYGGPPGGGRGGNGGPPGGHDGGRSGSGGGGGGGHHGGRH